jgi:hypothetical protein
MSKRNRLDEDGLPSDEIMTIVREIREYTGSDKRRKAEFEKKYPDFVERYPMLFQLACEPTFDLDRLEYMIKLRESIKTQETTLEDASKEIGQKMFDIYVKDRIPEPPK